MKRGDLKTRQLLSDHRKSKVQKYQELVIGQTGFSSLVRYELIILSCSWVPGALGLFVRSKLYPLLLGRVGESVTFGTNVVLRHPHKIFIGNNVVIDDHCLLDAKGINNAGIFIGDGVFVGRNSILSCKDGDIRLKDGVNIGFNCEVFSSGSVTVGENTLIAAYCYLIGGGNYDLTRVDVPFAEQDELTSKGGIQVERNVWIGANVKVLDGLTIGHDSAIGAGAVVTGSIPAFSVAAGVPARILRHRQSGNPYGIPGS